MKNRTFIILIIILILGTITYFTYYYLENNKSNIDEVIKYGDSTLEESGGLLMCMKYGIDRLLSEDGDINEYINFALENSYKNKRYGTSFRMIEAYSNIKGLKVRKIARTDVDALKLALQNGHPTVMLCGNGNFTETGKYILLYDIDSEDNVKLYDPISKEISRGTYTLYYIINNSSIVMEDKTAYWEIYAE